MELGEEGRLKAEFDANLDLWKHEEGVRLQRNTVLLSLNAFLAIGVSAMITVGPPVLAAVGITVVLALFGRASCWIWEGLQIRHVLYAEFRRKQLRELAARLGYESWENQWTGLRTDPPPEKVPFTQTDDSFNPPLWTRSAVEVESYLPVVVGLFWTVVAVASLLFLAAHLLSY